MLPHCYGRKSLWTKVQREYNENMEQGLLIDLVMNITDWFCYLRCVLVRQSDTHTHKTHHPVSTKQGHTAPSLRFNDQDK